MLIEAPPTANESGIVQLIPRGSIPVGRTASLVGERTKELFGQDVKVYEPPLHQSAVKTFNKCKRLYFWTQKLGLQRKGGYSAALNIGRWVHLALSHGAQPVHDDAAKVEPPSGVTAEEFKKTVDGDMYKALSIAEVLSSRYGELPPGFQAILVEENITARVRVRHLEGSEWSHLDQFIQIGGKLDILAEEIATGDLWIADHKTTTKPPVVLAKALSIDAQPIHYGLLAMAKYPDRRVVGCIHNIILKTTLKYPNSKVKDDDPGKYQQRVNEWYEKQDMLGQSDPQAIPFVRSRTRFHKDFADEYLGVLRGIEHSTTPSADYHSYPKVFDNFVCIQFKTPCPLLELCRAQPAQWQHLIARRFEQKAPDYRGETK